MEKIDDNLILKLAKLSYLELSDKEKKELVPQLRSILENFQKINAINTEGVKEWELSEFSEMAEDKVRGSFKTEKILESAPDKSGNLYKVPLVR